MVGNQHFPEHLQQDNIVPNCDHISDDEEIVKADRLLKERIPGDSGICLVVEQGRLVESGRLVLEFRPVYKDMNITQG